MERREYQVMFDVEDDHWWYAGLRELMKSYLPAGRNEPRQAFLDAGCGTGAVLQLLNTYGESSGIDLSSDALGFCQKRGLKRLVQGSLTHLPFIEGQFDWVISLDVLYHQGVTDDLQALREFRRVLKFSGKLLLNLPAFEVLRSPHDVAIHTRKRYRRVELRSKLLQCGFEIEKMTYRNSFLFFPIFLFRLFRNLQRRDEVPASDLERVPFGMNQFFLKMVKMENKWLRKFNFPFGTSLFCIASKQPVL